MTPLKFVNEYYIYYNEETDTFHYKEFSFPAEILKAAMKSTKDIIELDDQFTLVKKNNFLTINCLTLTKEDALNLIKFRNDKQRI